MYGDIYVKVHYRVLWQYSSMEVTRSQELGSKIASRHRYTCETDKGIYER